MRIDFSTVVEKVFMVTWVSLCGILSLYIFLNSISQIKSELHMDTAADYEAYNPYNEQFGYSSAEDIKLESLEGLRPPPEWRLTK